MIDKTELYQYTPIRSLQVGYNRSFYGLVTRFTAPYKSRGTDYCMTMAVIDPSLPSVASFDANEPSNFGGNALMVNIFNKDPTQMPAIGAVGNVVQFRHFKVQAYNDTIQAVSSFRSKWNVYVQRPEDGEWRRKPDRPVTEAERRHLEPFAAIKRKKNAPNGPDQAIYEEPSTTTPQSNDGKAHGDRVHPGHDGGADYSRPPVSISDISTSARDINVAVGAPRGPHSTHPVHHGLTRIAGLKPRGIYSIVATVFSRVARDRGAMHIITVTDYTENDMIAGNDAVHPPYLRKRILPVICWDRHADAARTLKIGDVVRVDGMMAEMRNERLIGTLHGQRAMGNITVLDSTCSEAVAIETAKSYLSRLESIADQFGVSVDSTVVTRRHPVFAVSSVMTVLSTREECGVWLVRVRVTDIRPSPPGRIRRNPFLFTLTASDDTGSLQLIAYGKDAEEFLSCTPVTFGPDQERALRALLGGLVPTPFLVKGYTVRGRRKYRLFDTVLATK